MNVYNGNISFQRMLFMVLTCVVFIAGSGFFCIANDMSVDEMLIICIFALVFMLVLIPVIIRKRLKGVIYTGSNYLRLFIVILLGQLFLIFSSYLPFNYVPMMILSFLITSLLDEGLSISICVFMLCVYAFCYNISIYGISSSILLCISGVLLATAAKDGDKRIRLMLSVLAGLISFLIPVLFYYLGTFLLDGDTLACFAISALAGAFFFGIVYNLLYRTFSREESIRYEIIMDEEYPILKELRFISAAEYAHAKTVSRISALCARAVDADALMAACAGLYYHGVNIERDKNIRTFAKRLDNRCFPPKLIGILLEDGTEGNLPSCRESAIVHMTDAVVTKYEAIFKSADKSTWNMNMVTYQTLNEMSSRGIYDKCGLSMNEFLKIRDILASQKFGSINVY